ncbi:MAG TPA: hypothetical protein VH144_00840 [Candidatus Saccharimonadales bacterium]|jgi:hypothetical protein|nr:hypothetical protein [Candidatus Saccharimonadales bacterium]
MEHIRFTPKQDSLDHPNNQKTALERDHDLAEIESDIKQQALASLVVRGIDIEGYNHQLSQTQPSPDLAPTPLAAELNFLARTVALFDNIALDDPTSTDPATRLAQYGERKAWMTGWMVEQYGLEVALPLVELYDEFLPLDFSAVELILRSSQIEAEAA